MTKFGQALFRVQPNFNCSILPLFKKLSLLWTRVVQRLFLEQEWSLPKKGQLQFGCAPQTRYIICWTKVIVPSIMATTIWSCSVKKVVTTKTRVITHRTKVITCWIGVIEIWLHSLDKGNCSLDRGGHSLDKGNCSLDKGGCSLDKGNQN